MKKIVYMFFAVATCIIFMTGCSFFDKPDNEPKDESQISSDTTDTETSEDEGEEIPVDNPDDASSQDDTTTTETTPEDTTSQEEPSDPRENVANDASKEHSGSGKYCGFIDSNSVEIELSDGSYCSFFVFNEDVRDTLSALDEEDMPEITFTYKAREGQINPEMISVIGG